MNGASALLRGSISVTQPGIPRLRPVLHVAAVQFYVDAVDVRLRVTVRCSSGGRFPRTPMTSGSKKFAENTAAEAGANAS